MEYEEALHEFFEAYNGMKKKYKLTLDIRFKGDEETKFSLFITWHREIESKIIVRVKEETDSEAFQRAKEELLRYFKLREGG